MLERNLGEAEEIKDCVFHRCARWAGKAWRTGELFSTTMSTDEGRTVYLRSKSTNELFHRDIYRALELRPSPIRRRQRER